MAVHVRDKSLFISLPSSPKEQSEITKVCVVWETRTTTASFSYFRLEMNAVIAYLARVLFWSHCRTEQIQIEFVFDQLSSSSSLSSAWDGLSLTDSSVSRGRQTSEPKTNSLPHNLSKHQICTWMIYPSQTDSSFQMEKNLSYCKV